MTIQISKYANKDLSNSEIATLLIHAGSNPDPVTGAILTPIYQTATYAQEAVGRDKGHTYSRASNPTVCALEDKLSQLESAAGAVCFATGMAAITTLFISLLKSGDHVICSDVVYGGTVRLVKHVLDKFGITVSFVDAADSVNVEKAILSNTKFIFIETPANPTLKLNDIQAIAKISKKHNLLLAVDNTFLTAVLQRPLALGADIVVYSTTKYIDGHNATVGGALLAQSKEYLELFDFNRKTLGSIQSPFAAWLILQGLKTLDLRLKQHSINALAVAKYLAKHSHVTKVIYPGLESFGQYELAGCQHNQYHGGMLAFEVEGGYENAVKVMNRVKLCTLAESLGSIETLITHPASMTHGPIAKEERNKIGITDGLIRLSVGLENVQDIISDLEQSL